MHRPTVLLRDDGRLLGTAIRSEIAERFKLLHLRPAQPLADHLPAQGQALAVLADAAETAQECTAVREAGQLSLVVTAEADGVRLLELLTAGANGYVEVRPDSGKAFWTALETVLGGHAYVPPSMLGGLLHQLVQVRRADAAPPVQDERFAKLSRREREVLDLLATGKDQRGIAEALVISPQTARTHIQNVLGKLGVHSRLEAVALVIESGQLRTGTEGR